MTYNLLRSMKYFSDAQKGCCVELTPWADDSAMTFTLVITKGNQAARDQLATELEQLLEDFFQENEHVDYRDGG